MEDPYPSMTPYEMFIQQTEFDNINCTSYII